MFSFLQSHVLKLDLDPASPQASSLARQVYQQNASNFFLDSLAS